MKCFLLCTVSTTRAGRSLPKWLEMLNLFSNAKENNGQWKLLKFITRASNLFVKYNVEQ